MVDEKDEMREIVADFVTETREIIEGLDNDLIELENSPDSMDLINKVFRCVHTIKGAAGFLGFTKIVDIVHNAENVLNKCRQGELKMTPTINDAVFKASDAIKTLLGNIHENRELSMDINPLLEDLRKCMITTDAAPAAAVAKKPSAEMTGTGRLIVEEEAVSETDLLAELGIERRGRRDSEEVPASGSKLPEKVPSNLERRRSPEEGQNFGRRETDKAEQTIRVDVTRLDEVMNLVGELVLGRNRILQIASELEQAHENDPLVQSLSDTVGQINMVTADLQQGVMKTRMQPVRKVFSRFPRMVRDLAKALGKNIELSLEGEDTELDKSVMEEIGDPLVHLVRNAVDHGIEMPEQRRQAGKADEAKITLAAFHEGNSIIIEVRDDGKGMDPEKLVKKAIEKGIVLESEVDRMSERDKLNLVMAPGFSTAEKTTDISGRGVGMDVVRNNVLKLNGTISITTEIGKGTTFSIKLPLTVAIIQALMVKVGIEYFALPLVSVVETVRTSVDSLQYVDQREVIHLRDEVLPLFRLKDVFEITTDEDSGRDEDWMYVVVIAIAEKKVGIVVEELLGQEEVVIKSIGKFIQPKGIAGATVLGNGKVTLIVDLGGLMEIIEEGGNVLAVGGTPRKSNSSKSGSKGKAVKKVLLVDDSNSARMMQKKFLEDKGFSVVEASNGIEGLRVLSENREIGLVVTDIMMPKMDGIEMTMKIRADEKLKTIPVVALSFVTENVKREECYKAGMDDFHTKTDLAGVVKTVRKYIS
ncbi:MAG: hybrid sensor histidine kinase/response regulator [Nitrospinota bacterium]|nr:hybrid sensor histidine kinase/response regulator [Nitrospinota bacterium]